MVTNDQEKEWNPDTESPPGALCNLHTQVERRRADQDFNSLDAQREAAEAFVKSQVNEGWICLPDATTTVDIRAAIPERPALQRLLADIKAGKIDNVIVYKVDRLSRSLLDFTKMMETFEEYHITFVAFTQNDQHGTSMGRLMLNVLMSFAQFERELVSERTSDKIAAADAKANGPEVMPFWATMSIHKNSSLSSTKRRLAAFRKSSTCTWSIKRSCPWSRNWNAEAGAPNVGRHAKAKNEAADISPRRACTNCCAM